MELAMRRRDSGERLGLLAFCRSEWTAGVGLPVLLVAFFGGVRQQLLGASEERREKVAVFGQCYSSWLRARA